MKYYLLTKWGAIAIGVGLVLVALIALGIGVYGYTLNWHLRRTAALERNVSNLQQRVWLLEGYMRHTTEPDSTGVPWLTFTEWQIEHGACASGR